MSPAEASLILCLSYGITAGIILAFFIHRKWGTSETFPGKGLDVSAFRANDVLFVGLLILFYLFLVSGSVEASRHISQTAAGQTAIPKPVLLLTSYIPLIAVAAAVIFRLRQPQLRAIPGWTGRSSAMNLVLYPVLGLGICYGFYILLIESGFDEWFRSLFSIKNSQNVVTYLQKGPLSVKLSIAFISIGLAPLIEEHVFRGYMYPVLKKYTGIVPAALFTSLLFGAVHASGAALLPLCFMSIVLIYLYEKTKTIWAPITMHIVFNAITVVGAFYNYYILPS